MLSDQADIKMESKSFKVIVDSNVWISFLIGKSLTGLQYHINSGLFAIISCEEQLQELKDVFRKPKIKRYFNDDQILEFFELLDESSKNVTLKTKIDICRDSKDNYLLSLAIDSNADYLITGDNDFLTLNKIGKTKIIRYIDFENLVNNRIV